jgi:hypothetical protein
MGVPKPVRRDGIEFYSGSKSLTRAIQAFQDMNGVPRARSNRN